VSPAHREDGETSAIGRAGALLRELRGGAGALGVSELARRTSLPKTTVHRLLRELVRVGLLERNGDAYGPSLLLFEIGQSAARQRSLQEAARPHLSVLAEATGHNVTLAVLEEGDVVYLDIFRARNGPRLPQRIGSRWPAHASAAGKALLAFGASPQALGERGPLRPLTERTVVEPAALARELARIRRHGVSYDRGESFPNVVGVAAPVLGAGDTAVAAVSISGVAGRLDVARLDAAVRTTALAVSRALDPALR